MLGPQTIKISEEEEENFQAFALLWEREETNCSHQWQLENVEWISHNINQTKEGKAFDKAN